MRKEAAPSVDSLAEGRARGVVERGWRFGLRGKFAPSVSARGGYACGRGSWKGKKSKLKRPPGYVTKTVVFDLAQQDRNMRSCMQNAKISGEV